MITDHAFESKFDSDICTFRIRPNGAVCALRRYAHSGQSPLGDGPVRSTVERQQEEIEALKASLEAAQMALNGERAVSANLEEKVISLRSQVSVLKESERALQARLSNLDTLAHQVAERVACLMDKLDR